MAGMGALAIAIPVAAFSAPDGASDVPRVDQRAAASGDAAAAERVLQAVGLPFTAGTMRLAAARDDDHAPGPFALWAYFSPEDTDTQMFLVGASGPPGGLHGECPAADATAMICASVVHRSGKARAYALVIGAAPGAVRVDIAAADGSTTAAVLNRGVWFARVPLAGAAAAHAIVVHRADGSVRTVPARDLDAAIAATARPVKPAAVSAGAAGH